MANIRKDPQALPETYALDVNRVREADLADNEDTSHELHGERFVCQRGIMLTSSSLQREKRQEVLAIFTARGIAILSPGDTVSDGRGILDVYSYPRFKSFGAADDSSFGFQVPGQLVGMSEEEEVFVCLYSEGSAHLMNTLVTRHAKR